MHTRRQWAAVKARCWFEEEPRVDFIRNIAPWDADDLDADRSRGLRLDPERPLIKVLLMAASGRKEPNNFPNQCLPYQAPASPTFTIPITPKGHLRSHLRQPVQP